MFTKRAETAVESHAGDAPPAATTDAATHSSGPEPRNAPSDADLWDEGCKAVRADDPASAVGYFRREAHHRLGQRSYGRAAVAFRVAAQQARLIGDLGAWSQLLHHAAAAYLQAADDLRLGKEAKRQALLAATKCLVQAEDLKGALACIQRALCGVGTGQADAELGNSAR